MHLAIPILKVSRQITKMQPDHHTHWPKSAIARGPTIWAEIDNSDGSSCLYYFSRSAIASTSTNASFGSRATSMVDRAGGALLKNSA
jgi:hypothetical protein